MLDPRGLFSFAQPQPEPTSLGRPVLLHAISGFLDAGSGSRLAAARLLAELPHRTLVTFDVDQVLDYRARRPPMTFVEDHWEAYEEPALTLSLVTDLAGVPFLLLTGPEPDIQWERFVAAVGVLVEHYDVRLTVGLQAIPMAVPHTRPTGVTAHATRPELVASHSRWVGTVQVPGNVAGLLEFRLGAAGHDAAGFAAHVPHYVAQAEYPEAAAVLLESVAALGDLTLPVAGLREQGQEVVTTIEGQVSEQPEVAAVVRALEEQYDAYLRGRDRSLLADEQVDLPSADELGAELERYLAEEDERRRGER